MQLLEQINKTKSMLILAGILCVLLTGACTTNQPTTVSGVVKAVNYDTGELTVTASNGSISKFVVDNSSTLNIPGTSLTDIAFEPGLAIQAQVEGKTATQIEIDLSKIDGIIQELSYNEFVLQPTGSSKPMQLYTKTFSKILKAGSPSPLNLLTMGHVAEVFYNPLSLTAYQISEMPPDFSGGN